MNRVNTHVNINCASSLFVCTCYLSISVYSVSVCKRLIVSFHRHQNWKLSTKLRPYNQQNIHLNHSKATEFHTMNASHTQNLVMLLMPLLLNASNLHFFPKMERTAIRLKCLEIVSAHRCRRATFQTTMELVQMKNNYDSN